MISFPFSVLILLCIRIYGVKLNGELTNKSSLGLFGKLEGSLINVNVESVFVDAKINTTQQVNVGILAGGYHTLPFKFCKGAVFELL